MLRVESICSTVKVFNISRGIRALRKAIEVAFQSGDAIFVRWKGFHEDEEGVIVKWVGRRISCHILIYCPLRQWMMLL